MVLVLRNTGNNYASLQHPHCSLALLKTGFDYNIIQGWRATGTDLDFSWNQ
jgi:hypothetical protein